MHVSRNEMMATLNLVISPLFSNRSTVIATLISISLKCSALINILILSVADPGGPRGPCPPRPRKQVIKKMAAKGGCIDFMFLAPSPYPAAGSATAYSVKNVSMRHRLKYMSAVRFPA